MSSSGLAVVGHQHAPVCRSCGAVLTNTFVDLGMSPLCQTQIAPDRLNHAETFYPLHAFICSGCLLVQLDEFVAPDEIFSAEYPYFSSFSTSWVAHAGRYASHMIDSGFVNEQSFVVEIASNDGYLLHHFVDRGIKCLGIEPAAGVAEAARDKGIPTVERFFGRDVAKEVRAEEGRAADLIVGNNVLAHVPNLNDFVAGVSDLLAKDGIATFEFPHLMRLMEFNQFDTIYHEHFCYFSLYAVLQVFERHTLRIFDVEELETHGGSLRIYVCHADRRGGQTSDRAEDVLAREEKAGLHDIAGYQDFASRVEDTKRKLLAFLIQAKNSGKTVVGYGAPGKGNTLLNYCGIREDFLDYTVDRNPVKQGTFTPGTRIPILDPERIFETKPDYILILPWNLSAEIVESMSDVRDWGGKFVTPIPEVRVLEAAQ